MQITPLREKFEEHGIRVRGFGPDNATAKLLMAKGFQAENIPKFLHGAFHNQRDLSKKEVWVVDEAGKLGNRSLLELLRLADKHHVKVILAGDADQLSSVDRGGIFRELCKSYDVHILGDIKRQENVIDRQIAKSLAIGEMGAALDELSRKEAIHWHKNSQASMANLIVDWSKDHIAAYNKKLRYVGLPIEETIPSPKGRQKSYDTSLIVAQTNQEVRDLNELAHNIRVAKGEISTEEFRCETLFGEVFISEGDRIEFRRNDRELGVTNGMSGTLLKASEEFFTVSVNESVKKTKLVTFNPKEYSGYQLGYATTCFRSQGRTVKHAYVLHSEYLNKQMAYVALTRHSKSVNYYVPEDKCKNIAQLKLAAGRDSSKESTVNYTYDYALEKEKSSSHREKQIQELHGSGNALKMGKSMFMDVSDSFKDLFQKASQRIQDRRMDKGFYEYREEKMGKSSFMVSRMEEELNKETVVSKAVSDFQEELMKKAVITKEIKSQEIGAYLEQEKQEQIQRPKEAPLNQYWQQVNQCKELQVVVEAEKEGGIKDIENSENFKLWQKACAKRNDCAYHLKSEDKANLNPKSLDIIESQTKRHEKHLKAQESHRIPILNEHLKFHIEPLLNKLFPDGPSMKTATTFRFGAKGSLSVTHTGEKTGQFYDFETQEGGGIMQLIEKRLGLNYNETKEWAKSFLDIAPSITLADAFQKPLKTYKEPSNWIAERPPTDKEPPSLKDLKMEGYWNEVARHEYRDKDGNLLYQVLRLQDKNAPKKKITPPLSYGRYKGEATSSWQLKGFKDENGKTPLYGLDKLDKNPRATVVVVEGEKAADFGSDKFLDKESYICMSWAGGAQGVSKADWTPLEGRKVLVWGDHDAPGEKAQLDVCKELKKLDRVVVKAIDHELLDQRNFPEKWDLADELPEGCSDLTINTLKNDAEAIIENHPKMESSLGKESVTDKNLDRGIDLGL